MVNLILGAVWALGIVYFGGSIYFELHQRG